MASSSSESPNSNRRWKYHVFLSFRGTDTRNNFTDHLFEALKQRGFVIFRDDEALARGEVISKELRKAIEESLISIVVLSQNYASSTWCLDELLKILESRKLLCRKVFPIFYEVDPSAVRHQTGSFKKAFEEHEERFRDDAEKVQHWRKALKEVAGLSGMDSTNSRETQLIKKIVKEVWIKLQPELPSFNNGLVGIDSKIAHVESLLRMELDDVRFIGIWGMGGIGKTTVATVVFNKIRSQFDICCFLDNIREVSGERGHGLVNLQRKLLSPLKLRGMKIENLEQGKDKIRSLLFNRKVLLVLDDVSSESQLENLAENEGWFGLGSRIIVTTRDSHILTFHEISAKYNVNFLNEAESLQLFHQKAFKSNEPPKPHFLELSKDVIQFSGGLPLALKVIGSVLRGREISIWEDALNMLKKDPQFDIWKMLRISYDGLLDMQKEIFLDIACFFKGWQKDHLIQILEKCGFNAIYGIEALIEKSLVTLDKNGNLGMHDLLLEMGRNIVYQECPTHACKRSRLWSLEDIDKVFKKNMGTESIQAVALNLSGPHEAHWNPEVFFKMCNLRLLIASSGLHLPLGLKCLPSGLKVLIWKNYPLKSLPLGVPLDELEHIEMPYSKINELCIDTQSFSKLVSLNLGYSEDLTKTPNFAGIPNLTKLDLRGCANLVEVDPSIGLHKKLVEVNLEGCINLEKLPKKLEMSSLEILHLDGCSNVGKVPDFGKTMISLSRLRLDGTAIVELPPSLGYLTGLHTLSLNKCKKLICLPNCFGNLKSLTDLSIMGCSQISKLPCNLAENEALQCLNALETAVRELPPSMVHLKNLKCLYVVEALLALPPPFSSSCLLRELILSGCNIKDESITQNLGSLSSLEILDLSVNNFVQLPCLSGLVKLKKFLLYSCPFLESLPMLPLGLKLLSTFYCNNSLASLFSEMSSLGINFEDVQIWLKTMRSRLSYTNFRGSTLTKISCFSMSDVGAQNLTKSMLPSRCLNMDDLTLVGCSLTDKLIPQILCYFPFLWMLDLSGNNFVNFPSDCFSLLFNLRGLWLNGCRSLESLPNLPPNVECVYLNYCPSLKSLPKLPPNAEYVTALNCISMKPPPDDYQQQILTLLAALMQWKYWLQPLRKKDPFEFQTVFQVPGSEIPQWFNNQNYRASTIPVSKCINFDAISITVDIPDNCYKSKCWGISVCLVVLDTIPSKGRRWLHCHSEIIGAEKSCFNPSHYLGYTNFFKGPHIWILYCQGQDLQFDQRKIQLKFYFDSFCKSEVKLGCVIRKCGYLVFTMEDAQAWCKTMTSQCRVEELRSNDDEKKVA